MHKLPWLPRLALAATIVAASAGPALANSITVPGSCPGTPNDYRFGGSCGARVLLDGATTPAFVQDNTSNAEKNYNVRMHFNLRNLTMTDGDAFDMFAAYDDTDSTDPTPPTVDGVPAFRFQITQAGGVKQLVIAAQPDGAAAEVTMAPIPVPVGWHSIEAAWSAAAGTGKVDVWFDGWKCDGTDHSTYPNSGPGACTGISGLSNNTRQVDYSRWGATAGLEASTTGNFKLDDFASQRSGYIGPAVPFGDVASNYWAYRFIQAFWAQNMIVAPRGCTAGNYCPGNNVKRREMAVFMVRGSHGPDFVPPPATGVFSDVPAADPDAPWIEQLYADGNTAGCATGPLRYCPEDTVNRDQMAVFLERLQHPQPWLPPVHPEQTFTDVNNAYWAHDWIEEAFDDGYTAGCGGGNYCPAGIVHEDEMATFLVRGFHVQLPQYGP